MLLFIIILTQGVLFLYLLSHMYCNSIKCVTIDDAIDKIDRDHGNIDPYWISMFKKFLRNKSNRRKVEKILG